jgi:hypothetical protein
LKLFSSSQKDKINKCEALDLVLIIDRSGSMADTEHGIILGHQKIIDAQEIISTAFKQRTEWLKNAFGAEDIKTFHSLAWFTREPLFSLIKDFPVYKEFCKWVDTLNGKISASKENIFGFLETLSPGQLAPLLENEASVIAATVLSRLPPNISAETLGKFPPDLKTEILKHIARKSEVFPEVLERVAAVLREKAEMKGETND